jgi:hypothetical protein
MIFVLVKQTVSSSVNPLKSFILQTRVPGMNIDGFLSSYLGYYHLFSIIRKDP